MSLLPNRQRDKCGGRLGRQSPRLCPDTHVEYERPGATGSQPLETLGKARQGLLLLPSLVCIYSTPVCVSVCFYALTMAAGAEPGLTEECWKQPH